MARCGRTTANTSPRRAAELGTSMEAVIHHFKLWTEGFQAPEGAVYTWRLNRRAASWAYTSKAMAAPTLPRPFPHALLRPTCKYATLDRKGQLVADLVALIGTVDIVLGDVDR